MAAATRPITSHGDRDLTRAWLWVGSLLHPQYGGRAEFIADGGAHGSRRYRRHVERNGSPIPVRPVRPDELALLPGLETAADTIREPLARNQTAS